MLEIPFYYLEGEVSGWDISLGQCLWLWYNLEYVECITRCISFLFRLLFWVIRGYNNWKL